MNADRFDHGEDPYSYPQIYRALRNTPSHLQHVSGQTVREESGNAAFSSPKSTQSEVVSTPAAEAGKTDVLPNASFVLSPIVQPIVPRKSKKSGRNLIPKLRTEVDANFEAIHFKATKASNFGDCYPLSSVAGFEITDLAEIANPTTKTIEFIRKLRVRSIDGVCGDSPIGGIRADITRQQEGVMARSLSASRQMSQWKNSGHWISDNRKLSAFFQFAIAYKGIDRPVACVETKDDTYYYDPIRIYGYKNPEGDLYVEPGTANKPASPPCFKTMPIEDVVKMLRNNPKSMSLVKYNGNDHFDPIVFCPPVSENNVTTMYFGV